MPSGLLFVLSEPGKAVSLDEFHDWYNNEHIPLRLNTLPSFLTGARFSAADTVAPSWLAVYDIDSTATFAHPSYTRYRTHRSPREVDLLHRIEVLDRRCYELLTDSGPSGLTTSFSVGNPSTVVVSQGLDVDGGDETFKNWVWNDLDVEGCLRTRTYKCIDNLRTGTGVGDGLEEQKVPKYLMIHELVSPSVADSSSFQDFTTKAGPGITVIEHRRWQLYRTYSCIAQGNVEAK